MSRRDSSRRTTSLTPSLGRLTLMSGAHEYGTGRAPGNGADNQVSQPGGPAR